MKCKAFFLLFFSMSGLSAQESPYESAQKIVDLMMSKNHQNIAEYYHPDSMEFIKDKLFPVIKLEIENDVSGSLARQLFASMSIKEIESMSSFEFSSQFLHSIKKTLDELRDIYDIEVLKGEIHEGELVHLITRIFMVDDNKEWTTRRLDVITLKKHKNKWMFYISDEIHSFIDIYRAKYDL